MRRVASIEVPPGGGGEGGKKKPPLETFRASVKCSDLSEARPTARKRSGVRTGCRVTCRLSEADMIESSSARGRVGRCPYKFAEVLALMVANPRTGCKH